MTVVARIRGRLREQRGFTLIELLTAAAIGSVIVLVAYGLLDSVVRTFGSSQHRVDVSQRGRQTMDRLTQTLRSQVCGGSETTGFTPSMLAGDVNRVVFWSNRSETLARSTSSSTPSTEADRRVRGLEYVPGTPGGQINELVYSPSATSASDASTRNRIATNVTANNGSGVFRYYAYNPQAANQSANPAPALFLELPTPLSAANLKRVVRITIGFTAFPENSTPTDKLAADFKGDFLSRSASSPYEFTEPPTDPAVVEPRCR